jgi:hypothetical protein
MSNNVVLYYDNASATKPSGGKRVFEAFDDFGALSETSGQAHRHRLDNRERRRLIFVYRSRGE